KRYLDLHERLDTFLVRWNQFAVDLSAPKLAGDVGALRQIEVVATTAWKAHYLATGCDAALVRHAEDVFTDVPADALMGTKSEIAWVRAQLIRHLKHVELARAATQLATYTGRLAGTTGPVSESLRRFFGDELGESSLLTEQVAERYKE